MENNNMVSEWKDELHKETKAILQTIAHENQPLSFSDSNLLGIDFVYEKWQIHLSSDDLTLQNKRTVERNLLANLKRRYPEESFLVYFRRVENAKSGDIAPLIRKNKIKRKISGIKHVIAVASGKGGVGKSTVTANLAVALRKLGYEVGILDADIEGPSIPTLFAHSQGLQMDGRGKLLPVKASGLKLMSFGFFSDIYSPVMWRGPLLGKSIEQFCFDVEWGELDFLLCDFPPGTSDIQLTIQEKIEITGAVIVTTPQDLALVDAHKAVSMFEKTSTKILGLVENMATFVCPQCGHQEDIFGESSASNFSQMRKIPILTQIPLHSSIRLSADTGRPMEFNSASVQRFMDLAKQVADKVIGEKV